MRPSETLVPRAPLDRLYRVPVEKSGPLSPAGEGGVPNQDLLTLSPALSLEGEGVYWMKTT